MLGGVDGLRERKKQRTRQAIRDTAVRLFVERGFDHVTVAEIAETAEVAEKTVFNYFGTKEALLFDDDAPIQHDLVAIIRDRGPGESAIAAVRRAVRRYLAHLEEPAAIPVYHQALRVVLQSPALQTYLRELFARAEPAVARVLAEETGAGPDSVEPGVAAMALVGVLWVLFERSLAAATSNRGVKAAVAALYSEADRALDLLERGLGTYAVAEPRPGEASRPSTGRDDPSEPG
jgi:AcrR family transcriptional regulator